MRPKKRPRKPFYRDLPGHIMIGHVGMDARRWAEAFVDLNRDKPISQDIMVGWFANAIMAGYDAALSRRRR